MRAWQAGFGAILLVLSGAVACSAPYDGQAQRVGTLSADRFRCDHPEPDARVRVEAVFTTEFGGIDAKGADVPTAPAEDFASYEVLRLGVVNGAERARIVLEDARNGGLSLSQNAWTQALAKGWVKVREPFAIERRGDGWCAVEGDRCNLQDKERSRFADSLGMTVDLLALRSELSKNLDGKISGGDLALMLPDLVARRLQLKPQSTAKLQKAGVPATFGLAQRTQTQSQRKTKTKDGVELVEPQTVYLDVDAKLVVDASCRVIEVSTTQRTFIPLFEGKLPSGMRLIRTLRWRFTPLAAAPQAADWPPRAWP
jgi:hypothetical protein